MTTKNQKEIIRAETLKKRLAYLKSHLDAKSKKIAKKLSELKEFKKAKNILFYMPIKNEVDIFPFLKKELKKKHIFLPRTKGKFLEPRLVRSVHDLQIAGKFKILEPKATCKKIEKKDLDIVIVPGIAYCHTCYRIGFGKGYYDRFLKDIKALKIGLAYEFQMHENIPAESHDQKMDLIITELKIYKP